MIIQVFAPGRKQEEKEGEKEDDGIIGDIILFWLFFCILVETPEQKYQTERNANFAFAVLFLNEDVKALSVQNPWSVEREKRKKKRPHGGGRFDFFLLLCF